MTTRKPLTNPVPPDPIDRVLVTEAAHVLTAVPTSPGPDTSPAPVINADQLATFLNAHPR